MTRIVRNIPMMDLIQFVLETPDMPLGVGAIQILQPVIGSCEDVVERLLAGYRSSEIDYPFNCYPVFPALAVPKWAEAERLDPDYHVRHLSLPEPGTERQLLDLVMDLHGSLLDRSRPGWIVYVIDGLENDRLAVYWKIHHAYIDGATAVQRTEASVATDPEDIEVRALWSPLFPHQSEAKPEPSLDQLARLLRSRTRSLGDVGAAFGRNLLQAGGLLQRNMPLPFSAPSTVFNRPVHATRRLGVGSTALAEFKNTAKQHDVTVNELVLSLIGAALERYAEERGEPPQRDLVAVCPMAVRERATGGAATQIAAISVRLGKPGSSLESRLGQVHASSRDAKEDAARMSSEALMDYLMLLAGFDGVIGKTPLGDLLPPISNVNVSNVVGPAQRCYVAGAEVVRSYPASTLAGGTAINITFQSISGRMDFAAISDALAIPDPQRIADYILDALHELQGSRTARPVRSGRGKTGARKRAAGTRTRTRKAAPGKTGRQAARKTASRRRS